MYVFDPDPPSMQHSKSRRLLKAVLHTQKEFEYKLRAYLLKTGVKHTFYDNRMPCHSTDLMWDNVDSGRQCRCCGQMLVSGDGAVKLMCCSKCKVVHYCDRACQKRDWKQVHKSVCSASSETNQIQEAMHICIRALSLMTLSAGRGYAPTRVQTKANLLDEFFSFEKEGATSDLGDAMPTYAMISDRANNYVCNHFREAKESGRILFPIWDTVVENLVFVPISLDFMKTGLGFGDATVEDCRISLDNNDDVYFLLLHGTQGCVGANTWVSIPGTRRKQCQKARGATKIATQ